MTRIIGLIQARMGSTRLPGKMMKTIVGKPMIGHIVERLAQVPGLSGQVLATTADPRNDEMVAYVESLGVSVYREQAEDDIAARLCGAAKLTHADAVLKINGDCPMVDVAVLQQLIDLFLSEDGVDYASNKIEWSYPEGLSAEVIATTALCWCDESLKTDEDREFVANLIRDDRDRFKVLSLTYERDLTQHTWCVDTPQDLAFTRSVFDALYHTNPIFSMDDILHYLNLPEPQ